MPLSLLCLNAARLIALQRLQPSSALLAALVRASAIPLELHPRLVRDAVHSKACRTNNLAGISESSWLGLLTHHLCQGSNAVKMLVWAVGQGMEGSGGGPATPGLHLPPPTIAAWLQMASGAALQIADHFGEEGFGIGWCMLSVESCEVEC